MNFLQNLKGQSSTVLKSFSNLFKPKKSKLSPSIQADNKQKKSSFGSATLQNLQKLGKSLIFPIAVLPFAALFNRFGTLGMQIAVLEGHFHMFDWWIAKVIQTPGATVFNYLPLIFALGTGFGWAKDNRGEAALIAGLFYTIISVFMQEGMLPSLFYSHVLTFRNNETGKLYSSLFYLPTYNNATKQITNQKYILDIGVLGGIVSGVFTAFLYNKYRLIKLPQSLSFFGGRRFVPMVAGVCSIPVAFLFAIIWPWIQYVLVYFGRAISSNPSIAIPGAFCYGVINRLLQPFGLHHILNTFLWFQLPVSGHVVNFLGQVQGNPNQLVYANGDINAFNKGIAEAGTFQSGYFPLFLGGEPAAALAMFFAIKNKVRRKEVGVFLLGVGFIAFLTGIDEPLVFSFIFVSPLLWVCYALFTGIGCAITIACHIHIGFGFSAGLIDYIISFAQAWGNSRYYASTNGAVAGFFANPLMIWPIAVISFGMFFGSFLYLIRRFNIMTPGRSEAAVTGSASFSFFMADDEKAAFEKDQEKAKKPKGKKALRARKYEIMAEKIYTALGGYENVISIGNCATRLRMQLKDNSAEKINDPLIRSINPVGVDNIIRLGDKGFQVIIGTDVESVLQPLQALIDEKHKLPSQLPKKDDKPVKEPIKVEVKEVPKDKVISEKKPSNQAKKNITDQKAKTEKPSSVSAAKKTTKNSDQKQVKSKEK